MVWYGMVSYKYIFIAPYSPKGGIGLVKINVFSTTTKKVRKKFANHYTRKTTVSKLKKAAKIVSSENIANVTGHRGINFFKYTSCKRFS